MALVKISANLSKDVVADMKELAERKGVTLTEVFRQALATEKFLDDERRKGTRIVLEREGETKREMLIR